MPESTVFPRSILSIYHFKEWTEKHSLYINLTTSKKAKGSQNWKVQIQNPQEWNPSLVGSLWWGLLWAGWRLLQRLCCLRKDWKQQILNLLRDDEAWKEYLQLLRMCGRFIKMMYHIGITKLCTNYFGPHKKQFCQRKEKKNHWPTMPKTLWRLTQKSFKSFKASG